MSRQPNRVKRLCAASSMDGESEAVGEARDGVLRLAQEVPLTHEERAVAGGNVQALNRYIQKRTSVPLQIPDWRYAFNGRHRCEQVARPPRD